MFLFAAFQAHLSKIMLKIYESTKKRQHYFDILKAFSVRHEIEIGTLIVVLEGKDRYCLSQDDIHLKGTYLLLAKRRLFALEYLGSMNLQFDF